MGILNVTPDSFSDGGRFFDPEGAVQHGLDLIAQGADILDVGGESTRPGAHPVEEAEELRRVIPVIRALRERTQVPISIDTMKIGVARAALAAGADIVNDVGANRRQPEMWRLVAESGAGYVCMHMQGSPQSMQQNPTYADVVTEVAGFLGERLRELGEQGVQPASVVLDPGIGFGKTWEHNLDLLAAVTTLQALGRPILIGVSRKSFLGRFDGATVDKRLAAGLACACLAVAGGAQLVRTHDVAETRQALRMTEAIVQRKQLHAGSAESP